MLVGFRPRVRRCRCWEMRGGRRYVIFVLFRLAVCSSFGLPFLPLTQRKANGVDVSIDAAELEGMSEEDLRRRYDESSRGGRAGVPGAGNSEDFSDMVAREMAKKRQKMEAERDRGKKGQGKEFKF